MGPGDSSVMLYSCPSCEASNNSIYRRCVWNVVSTGSNSGEPKLLETRLAYTHAYAQHIEISFMNTQIKHTAPAVADVPQGACVREQAHAAFRDTTADRDGVAQGACVHE
eukprot:2487535-Amphidinium_carterae.1